MRAKCGIPAMQVRLNRSARGEGPFLKNSPHSTPNPVATLHEPPKHLPLARSLDQRDKFGNVLRRLHLPLGLALLDERADAFVRVGLLAGPYERPGIDGLRLLRLGLG